MFMQVKITLFNKIYFKLLLYYMAMSVSSLVGGQLCGKQAKNVEIKNVCVATQYELGDFQSKESKETKAESVTPFVASQLLINHCEHGTLTKEIRNELVNVYGADINACCGSPLLRAVENGHENVVDLLLEVNVDATKQDSAALRYASAKGHTAIIKKLIKAGARPLAWSGALFPAAENGHLEAVQLLVNYPDPSIQYCFNRSLCIACQKGFLPIVNIFMQHLDKCDLNTCEGKPLKSICEQLTILLQKNTEVTEKVAQYLEIIYLLLENGATPVYSLCDLVALSTQFNEVLLLDYLLRVGSTAGNYPINEKTIKQSISIATQNNFGQALQLLQEYEKFLKSCSKNWWGGFERL